ncbi:hypothetical protein [Pleurochrysis sp. Polinton-like virus]|nr:hypothetical protein [Pleurochrysis sp. Polinton-like virus]
MLHGIPTQQHTMPKVKQPKTSQVTETANLVEDSTNHADDTANHTPLDTTHAVDDDMRKKRIAEIRRKWTKTREANKKRERAKEEEVRSTLTTLKQETESVKTKLSETSKYDSVIEDLRRELSAAIEDIKQERRKARTLKRVEFYGDDEDHHPTETQHAQIPTQPTIRQGKHPAPPSHRPPAAWSTTSWASQNPFNTF